MPDHSDSESFHVISLWCSTHSRSDTAALHDHSVSSTSIIPPLLSFTVIIPSLSVWTTLLLHPLFLWEARRRRPVKFITRSSGSCPASAHACQPIGSRHACRMRWRGDERRHGPMGGRFWVKTRLKSSQCERQHRWGYLRSKPFFFLFHFITPLRLGERVARVPTAKEEPCS